MKTDHRICVVLVFWKHYLKPYVVLCHYVNMNYLTEAANLNLLKMIRYLDSIFFLYGLCQHKLVLYDQCVNYYNWNNSSGLASTFYENLQVILRSISILQISKFEKSALKSFNHRYLQLDIKDLILKSYLRCFFYFWNFQSIKS